MQDMQILSKLQQNCWIRETTDKCIELLCDVPRKGAPIMFHLILILLCPLILVQKGWSLNITILHTNDVHARFVPYDHRMRLCSSRTDPTKCYGGAARRATAIKNIRSSYKNVILLDGGDQFQRSYATANLVEKGGRIRRTKQNAGLKEYKVPRTTKCQGLHYEPQNPWTKLDASPTPLLKRIREKSNKDKKHRWTEQAVLKVAHQFPKRKVDEITKDNGVGRLQYVRNQKENCVQDALD
uniref:5'-nucleotidase n=1 Tax=Romanomermis culicivorax TaxID=13658 RepID=A0A915JNI8_ROMCU